MQCTQIDFLNSKKSHKSRDLAKSLRVANRVANAKRHGSPKTRSQLQTYCDTRDWLTDHPRKNDVISCNSTPLQNTIPRKGRQYVLGRMSTLEPYYKCPNQQICLDSEDWDDLYKVNDLFIYCTTLRSDDFPIRIVFSSADYLKDVPSQDRDILNHKRPVILSRELCQLQNYFELQFQQSINEPNIFFASTKKPHRIRNFKSFHVRQVTL